MKTIFFGASAYVIPLIEYLNNNFDLALVVTTESRSTDAVPAFCTTHNIPFITVTKLTEEVVEKIKNLNTPFAVLADFRLMIRQPVIDIFPKGIINIHPSLLPEYRGPTPGTTAILDGKITTGVSLMLLDKELDHGPVLGQIEQTIEPTDTSVTLYTKLFGKGVALLEKYLEPYLSGTLHPKEQDHTKATYTKFLTRESGYISPDKPIEKEKLERMVKAYFPWPGVWTKWQINGKGKTVKFLPDETIQVEGKKPMKYKDFLNGYPNAKEFLEKLNLT